MFITARLLQGENICLQYGGEFFGQVSLHRNRIHAPVGQRDTVHPGVTRIADFAFFAPFVAYHQHS